MSELLKIISKGEGLSLDFKKEISNSQKIAATIVAFANSEGGSLFVGVKDNGKIKGINPSEEVFMINQAIDEYVKPKVEIETSIWQEKHYLVLEVIVSKSSQIHTAMDDDGVWKSFVRIGDHTCHTNKVIDLSWKLQDDASENKKFSAECQAELIEKLKEGGQTLSSLYKTSEFSLKEVDYNLSYLLYKEQIHYSFVNGHLQYDVKAQ